MMIGGVLEAGQPMLPVILDFVSQLPGVSELVRHQDIGLEKVDNAFVRKTVKSFVFSGGSKGGAPGSYPSLSGSNFFHFHAVFGKNLAE